MFIEQYRPASPQTWFAPDPVRPKPGSARPIRPRPGSYQTRFAPDNLRRIPRSTKTYIYICVHHMSRANKVWGEPGLGEPGLGRAGSGQPGMGGTRSGANEIWGEQGLRRTKSEAMEIWGGPGGGGLHLKEIWNASQSGTKTHEYA